MREPVYITPWDKPYADKEGLMSRCQACRHPFLPTDSKVQGETDKDVHLVHVFCRNCRLATLLKVRMDETGIHVEALQTELTATETPLKVKGKRVSADDVLDVWMLLKEETPGRDFIDEILDVM